MVYVRLKVEGRLKHDSRRDLVIEQPSIDWQTSNIIERLLFATTWAPVMSFRQLTRGLVGVEWMALCWCKGVMSHHNRRWGSSYRWFPDIKRRKHLNVSRTRWRITHFYQYTEVCVSGQSSWESVLEMNNQGKCNLYSIPNQRPFYTVLFRWPWLQS